MGMFDRLTEQDGTEWQTKAFENQLANYKAGDKMPALENHPELHDYQVEIYRHHPARLENIDSFATVRGDLLARIDVPRDKALPRVAYYGALYHPDAEAELEAGAMNG